MSVIVSNVGPYRLLSVWEPLTLSSDMDQLPIIVQRCLSKGDEHIALAFDERSYFSSGIISVLIRCIEILRLKGGMLTLVAPNKQLLELLQTLDLYDRVCVCPSVDELETASPHTPG